MFLRLQPITTFACLPKCHLSFKVRTQLRTAFFIFRSGLTVTGLSRVYYIYIYIRGRVSKQVTNGSKTAVMNVIVFLRVSLGSSTVQLYDRHSRCACAYSEAGFNSQHGDRAWRLYNRRAAFCCAFLWAKGLNAKDIHKEMCPVYGGKCLSRKAVHSWIANVSLITKRLKRRCGSG
jgi:hypothetical protein